MTQPWCDMFKSIYFCCQAGRKIAHTPYLRLFQSSFNIEARSSCIFQDSGWIFALLHRVGCNTAVILHMFEGCEWLAGGTSREEGSSAHFCATLRSITTAGILLARRQHLQTDFSAQSLLPPMQSFLRVINWNSWCFEEKKWFSLLSVFRCYRATGLVAGIQCRRHALVKPTNGAQLRTTITTDSISALGHRTLKVGEVSRTGHSRPPGHLSNKSLCVPMITIVE